MTNVSNCLIWNAYNNVGVTSICRGATKCYIHVHHVDQNNFTVRCFAERGYAKASCLSIRLSVCDEKIC